MKQRNLQRAMFFLLLFAFQTLESENYIVRGTQKSTINYSLSQQIVPPGKVNYVKFSFVVPQTFISPTYVQRISNFNLQTNPAPDTRKERKDKRGNRIIELLWRNTTNPVEATISLTANNQTSLSKLKSTACYPLTTIASDARVYIYPSVQVQSDHPDIITKSQQLIGDVKTQFEAVQRVLTWVIDHMHYVTPPEKYDALYSFRTGLGNCQNYSHIAAALMRAGRIPVRIVNGVTLKEPYTMKMGQGEYKFKMGQGRHSWIEVWFPDLGWVPFDPQQTELFVSNRFIRIETGVDNHETENDGVVKYSQAMNVKGRPEFRESIEASFALDEVRLITQKQSYGPRAMLLCPEMEVTFKPVNTYVKPPPKPVTSLELQKIKFNKRHVFGNLNFPRNQSFLSSRDRQSGSGENEFVLKKNFMVETAEYITKKMTQYAQVIVIEKPVKLEQVALALHKFGGSGQVWMELMADKQGRPGLRLAVSGLKDLKDIPRKTGYDWVEFSFQKDKPVLKPGRYWVALGFTGSPILNWFYTYGKPVGPIDGTRYKSVYDDRWSGALAFEFNYKVTGLMSGKGR